MTLSSPVNPPKNEMQEVERPTVVETDVKALTVFGKPILRKVFRILSILALSVLLAVAGINAWVLYTTKDRILSEEDVATLSDVDGILVLGCKVYADGRPSDMLRDRLLQGISLQKSGCSEKLLMSGDHGRADYNEVGVMKRFAIEQGVASEDVFMDHAGFNTYESLYRAKEVFEADRIVIVTQSYHLPRALYIAKQLGIEAWGVSADLDTYAGQFYRDLREIAARVKDFFSCIFCPSPTYLGDAVPLSGNGDATNDETFSSSAVAVLPLRLRNLKV